MSAKRVYLIFAFFFASFLLSAQPHIRLSSITGPNFPNATDTVFQYLSYSSINIVIQNLDTVSFIDTLDILIKGDTGTYDTLLPGSSDSIAAGDSTTLIANQFTFKPTNFDDGDNIVVIWPAARHSNPQIDSLSFHIYYISNASFVDDVKKEPLILYPNPATGYIYFGGDVNLKIKRVRIMDDSGRMVYDDTTLNRYLSIEQWAYGLYLINIEKQDGTHQVLKLVKVN